MTEETKKRQRENTRQWRKNNQDKIKEYSKRYWVENKEARREYGKRRRIINKDKIAEYFKGEQFYMWRKKNKDKIKNNSLKHYFGITLEDYNEMFNKQNGCCAICGKHQSEFKRALGVDHNHLNGNIRELLCHGCNAGLGNLKDSEDLLEKAFLYLKKHNIGVNN